MDEAVAAENFTECFKFEVAAWFFFFGRILPMSPARLVSSGGGEAICHEGWHAHAALWKASDSILAPIGLFHVFAQGELDPGRSALKLEILWRRAVAEFDNTVLTADRIGRAVEEIGDGETAGQFFLDAAGLGVNDIADANH